MPFRTCLILLLSMLAPLTAAPVFENLAAFDQPGEQPMTPLLYVASDGNYYGTTSDGGIYNKGTVFRMTPGGMITTLVHFTGVNGSAPGSSPSGGLVQWDGGWLYGVTLRGGTEDCGTVFKISTGGSFASVTQFNGINTGLLNGGIITPRGAAPNELMLHTDGNLYGTTQAGGASNAGTLYRVSSLLGIISFTTLVNFTGIAGGYRGSEPVGTLVASGSYFYGATRAGGTYDYGTIFKVGTGGGSFSILTEFTGAVGARPGGSPAAGLTLHPDNMLYGTTEIGGTDDVGTVFRVSTTGVFAPLKSFTDFDGAYPSGRLFVGQDLALYGTTSAGGNDAEGTIFKITNAGALTTLVHLTGKTGVAPGSAPLAGLAKGAVDGEMVGTTSAGGAGGAGTVFKLMPGGVFMPLANFTNVNGWEPAGTPAVDAQGAVVVALKHGGALGEGTLLRFQGGTPAVPVANFGGVLGEEPQGGLSLIGDTIYGATRRGGANDRGTIFSYVQAGPVATLGTFSNYAGTSPEGPPTQGPDGFLYIVAREGGGYGKGSIVRFTPGGARQTVISFTGISGGARGQHPRAPLAFAADGTIYGVTEGDTQSGDLDYGTIFSLSPTGTFTTLVEFNVGLRTPRAGLVSLADGSFAGTTAFGGAAGVGGVFKVTKEGVFTVLGEFNGNDGAKPAAPLVVAVDGTIYGTTTSGGANDMGSVFRLPTSGSLARIVSFTGTSGGAPGENPAGGLAFGQDGSLYGATSSGGPGGGGTVFRIRQLGPNVATDPATFLLGLPVLHGRVNAGGEITTAYFEYGPTPALGQNTLLTPSVIIPLLGGVSKFETTLVSLAIGQTLYFRAVAVNSSGTSYGQTLSFTVPTPLNLWLLENFGNSTVSLLADSDGDGKLNLLEYALGTSPVQPDSTQPAATIKQYPEGRRLMITVQRDPAHNDITIEVQAGSALAGPWATVASSVNGAPFSGPGYVGGDGSGGGVKQVEIRDPAAANNGPQRFMRVKVTQ